MTNSSSTKILPAALFTLVPMAYLSIPMWQPSVPSFMPNYSPGLQFACITLMGSVFVVSFLSWRTYRLVSAFGFLACFLWLCIFLLPVYR